MPKRKRTSKAKRSRKRARIKSARRTTVKVTGRGPIAPRTLAKLKYSESFSTTGATIDQVMNLNSLYDPDRTGTGHQPYGFDQYATWYNRYRVYKTKVILKAVNLNTTVDSAYKISVLASNTTSTITNPPLASEMPGSYTKIIQGGLNTTFKMTYKLPKVNGQTSAQYKADDRFQALTTADPSENIVLHIVTSTLDDGIPTSGSVKFFVTMVFYAELFDPKDLGQS